MGVEIINYNFVINENGLIVVFFRKICINWNWLEVVDNWKFKSNLNFLSFVYKGLLSLNFVG